jgi:TFIIF-interacting CTD phosphatase-like protein
MSKSQVAVELEKMRGSVAKVSVPVVEEKKVAVEKKEKKEKVVDVPSAPAVLEKVAKKVAVEKKEKVVAVEKEEKMVPSKYIKGSDAAKERMAEIRSRRGKKTE